jgi:hypothetical protein
MENKHGNPIAFLKWVANYYNENGERIRLLDGEFHFVELEDDTQVLVTPEQLVELYGIQQGDEKELSTLKAQQGGVTDTILLDRLGLALENIYRIHSDQWTEYDRTVIKGIIDQWDQSKKDQLIPASATVTVRMVNMNEVEKLKKQHADLNLALAGMLNGYQNLSMYQKDWFTVPKDLIDVYTKMVIEYAKPGEGKEVENG